MDDDFEILKSKVIICYFLLKIEKNKLYIYFFFLEINTLLAYITTCLSCLLFSLRRN